MLSATLTVIGAFVVWLVLYNLVFVGIPTVLGKWYARSIRRTIPKTFAFMWKLTVMLFKALVRLRQSTTLPQTIVEPTQAPLRATYVGKTGRDIVSTPSAVRKPITIEHQCSKLNKMK